ncbi:hypothetical protein M0R45_030330 [Rubus argutus]|uniref:Acyl-CoA oxidase C-terminal domain-containing protein n=1 Tax=Rubus argutus TaxID=59490 RepID=A0AAW1WAP2_RUBAR
MEDTVDHLAHERSKAQFNVEEMKIIWAGSLHALQVSDRIAKLVASDPGFGKENRAVLSRKDLFKSALKKAAYVWKRINELGLSEEETSWLRFYVDELAYDYVHWGMFVPAIKGSATEEQQNNWRHSSYIYSLNLIHKHLGDFLSTRSITPKQASLASDQLRSLYAKVRPNAIALVDAFNYTDHFLGSVLGSYDGNVYPKLYEEAWKEPLNESVVPDGYHEYIRPVLKQQLQNARL